MICEGAQAGNVMPQNMWAVINFRLACHDSIDTLLKACLKLVGDEIKCSYIPVSYTHLLMLVISVITVIYEKAAEQYNENCLIV